MNLAMDEEFFKTPEGVDAIYRSLPHSYAEKASDGLWHPYNYLQLLGTVVAKAIIQGGGKIIVQAPPRHGKSEFLSHWLPTWFLDTWPQKKVILATYSGTYSAEWGRKVRNELTHNPYCRNAKVSQDNKAANRWSTTEGGGMYAVGVGGAMTGRGGHLLLIDDPIKNWAEATSQTIRDGQKKWYESTFSTRAEPGASTVILMTRWHQDDLAGWLQNSQDDWIVINLPAIAESVGDLMRRKPGESLCPERYDEKALEKIKKSVGELVWTFLFQQRPTPLEGNIVKRKQIRRYSRVPDGAVYAQSWDLPLDQSETSSFAVGQVWARHGADRYLVDQVRKRMDFNQMLDAIKDLTKKWPQARLKLVENKSAGAPAIASLRKKISGFVKINPRGSKEARLIGVTPAFRSGNVYVPYKEACPWVEDWIEEIVNFPKAPNDDQVDTTSQILEYWETDKPVTVVPASQTRASPIHM